MSTIFIAYSNVADSKVIRELDYLRTKLEPIQNDLEKLPNRLELSKRGEEQGNISTRLNNEKNEITDTIDILTN